MEDRGHLNISKNDVHHLLTLSRQHMEQLQKLNEAIYGSNERPGINTRLTVIEGRQQTFWGALGVLGVAATTALVNVVIGVFKS